ncbi:MAG: IS21 family transposase [Actinobacteria bacterium]|nr:IS21 family transposase [Actinomycetota bacterium]MCA1697833.1 IS21 family transposase [Actinomycetota bacterium]
MLTGEEDVEVHALRGRGWSISAIARHLGCDRKTVRACLSSERVRREPAPSSLEAFREYIEARFDDDPHLPASVLLRELGELGFGRSYPTLTRELRRLSLRPVCFCCRRGGPDVTVEIEHPPGEELQFDWLELSETPWGEPAYVLVGALSYSGCFRCRFSEAMTGAHTIEALDWVLRGLGGTARRWRTDRMAGVVYPGTDRLLPEFCECAKHYGVAVDVCPARRAKRKGVVEAAIKYLTRSWWCSAAVATPAAAQTSADRFCLEVSDRRPRGKQTVSELAAAEPLRSLPARPFPAQLRVERRVSRSALVAFDGNRYSVPSALVGEVVEVRARVGEPTLDLVSPAGIVVACHHRAPAGSGQLVRCSEHAADLERAVLAAFTTRPPCRRKHNRPPGQAALEAAARLGGQGTEAPVIDLERYAQIARVAR